MPIYQGNTKIGDLVYNNQAISKAYYGSVLVYDKIKPVTLTVNNGSGSGSYLPGTVVPVTGNLPSGYTWNGWTINVSSPGFNLASTSNRSTNATIGTGNSTITGNTSVNPVTFSNILYANNFDGIKISKIVEQPYGQPYNVSQIDLIGSIYNNNRFGLSNTFLTTGSYTYGFTLSIQDISNTLLFQFAFSNASVTPSQPPYQFGYRIDVSNPFSTNNYYYFSNAGNYWFSMLYDAGWIETYINTTRIDRRQSNDGRIFIEIIGYLYIDEVMIIKNSPNFNQTFQIPTSSIVATLPTS